MTCTANSSTQLAIDAIYDRMAMTERDMEEIKAEFRELVRGVKERERNLDKRFDERERNLDKRFDDLTKIILEMYNAFTGMFHSFLVSIDH